MDSPENKSQDNIQERRASLRIPLRVLKVDIKNPKREIFFGYAQNISSSGMHIQTSSPREIGSRFDITFDLPNEKGKILKTEAEVAWVRDYDPKAKTMPGMGIKFVNLSKETQKAIEDFIEKN